jgi:asparagine synthase (glutamine-hydrolysing)
MCGIAGLWVRGGARPDRPLAEIAGAMARTLAHRGPDADGVWADPEAGLAFGHRRLSIIDLSAAGAQPMVSHCGRYAIVYNGELYNAAALRPDLEARGIGFRGHSDTEVLLEACAAYGVAEAVGRAIGMFAFALWDRPARRLHLVRDRLGIKPLYWTRIGQTFAFASELKAFAALPGWAPTIDRGALAAFFGRGYVPAPATIFGEARKLEPGVVMTLDGEGEPEIKRFWRLDDIVREAEKDAGGLDDGAAVDALKAVLGDAVRRRMVADVPLGAFLSGGIDSSVVVALMQNAADRPVRTFTIGFSERGYDEAQDAARVAEHLETDHTALVVSPDEARAVIPDLPAIYDEPFADSSQIPTYLISKLARGQVTVALSGDGGDEVFAGYNRHIQAERLERLARPGTRGLARLAGRAAQAVPPGVWRGVAAALPGPVRPRLGADKMRKLAAVVGRDAAASYAELTGLWRAPERLVAGLGPGQAGAEPPWLPSGAAERMQFRDTLGYLPDDILTKVDRASMAVSLEVRVPMLDHRVVAFAWGLAPRQRIRDGQGKWLLRQLLARHVPRHLFERPKMGFAVPIDAWLRGPLREWAGDLLSPDTLAGSGLLRSAPITSALDEHLSGRADRHHELWTVLMFEAWRRSAVAPLAAAPA